MILNMTGGSGGKVDGSDIIVTAPTGSTVTASFNGSTKNATEDNGTWTFSGCNVGVWTITAQKTGQTATTTVNIQEDGQLMRYYVTLSYFTASISATYPTGSTCTCTKGSTVFTATNTSGSYIFTVPEAGDWVVSCTDGANTASQTVVITTDGQAESVNLGYQLYASDFDWAAYGTLDEDYEVVYDDDTPIPQNLWGSARNWKVRLLTSGLHSLVPLKDGDIDVFAVGGGGGGNSAACGGAGGGYTSTGTVQIEEGTEYPITIGAGGQPTQTGGTTSAFGINVNGGNPPGQIGNMFSGGDGGSGGGSGSTGGPSGNGGSNGNDGESTSQGSGGKGQGSTTREFGESSAKLYAGGAGGNIYVGTGGIGGEGGGGTNGPGEPNTGGGGSNNSNGGSGIVVFRNARGGAA